MRRLALAVVLWSGAASVGAQTQDSVVTMDSLVVTAARRAQLLKNVVVATKVVTRRELVEGGSASVGEVLQRRGLTPEPGLPGGQSVLINGLGGPRLLVLIDGRPLIGNVGGTVDLSRIPVEMLDRIEIVSGPQSTLYGSAAMAGVINLIMRRPAPGGLIPELAITAGSQERLNLHAAASGTARSIAYRIEGGRQYSGLAAGVAGNDATYSRRWDGAVRLDAPLRDVVNSTARFLIIDEEQRYRTGQLFRFVDRTQVDASVLTSWTLAPSHKIDVTVHGSQFTHLARASTGAQPVTAGGDDDEQRLLELSALYGGQLGGVLLDAGVDLRRERIQADRVPGGRRTLDLAEPFAQFTVERPRWSVAPGVRISLSDRWGERVTPRVAALVRLNHDVTVRASWSEGFRAPDFKELYIEFVNTAAGYAVAGNPDLKPESSSAFALDTEWLLGRISARVGAHYTRYRDFIETTEPDASGVFTYGNVARGRIAGVDTELRARLSPLQLELGYTHLNARDVATGTPLLGSAAHVGRAVAGAMLGQTNLEVSAHYTGDTPLRRTGGEITQTRDAWTSLNLRVARPILPDLNASFTVHNALDSQQGADWPGFTGRQIALRISWAQ